MANLIDSVLRQKRVLSGVILAIIVFGSPVLLASPVTVVEQMQDCASISSPNSRLQCYDKLSESLQPGHNVVGSTQALTKAAPSAAEPPKAIEVAAVKPPEKAKKQKAKKKTVFRNKEHKQPDVKLTLIEAKKDSRRRWLFYFENGQVWRQLERGYVSIPEGDAVPATLSEGFFGSQNLRLGDNKKFIKVKRVK